MVIPDHVGVVQDLLAAHETHSLLHAIAEKRAPICALGYGIFLLCGAPRGPHQLSVDRNSGGDIVRKRTLTGVSMATQFESPWIAQFESVLHDRVEELAVGMQ